MDLEEFWEVYLKSFLHVSGFILLLIVLLISMLIPLMNYSEAVNCGTMENFGYETELYAETLLTDVCMIKLTNESKYIPYNKMRHYQK